MMKRLLLRLIDKTAAWCWPRGRVRVIQDRNIPTESYISRYYIVFRRWSWIGDLFNVFLHRIWRSDAANEVHTHPGGSISIILTGGYVEHTPKGSFVRKPGDIVFRGRDYAHRIELRASDDPCYTLFMTWWWFGHKWGFRVGNRTVDHKVYLARKSRTA